MENIAFCTALEHYALLVTFSGTLQAPPLFPSSLPPSLPALQSAQFDGKVLAGLPGEELVAFCDALEPHALVVGARRRSGFERYAANLKRAHRL